jgi:hypothetical protein
MLCRFQKCKRKVPPPLLLSDEKSPFTLKGYFSLLRSDGGGTFPLGIRNNWYQFYNSTIIEIGAQRPQSGPIA